MNIKPWLCHAVLLFVVLSTSPMKGQLGPNNPGPESSQTPAESEEMRKFKKEVAKKANKERQDEIQRDTEKLLKLATELKEYVGKTDEHILSLDVIKKAEEIEKLARGVKEKMKTSY